MLFSMSSLYISLIRLLRAQFSREVLENALVQRCQELDIVTGLRHVLQ
jgi:hypothetical protein